MNINKRNKIIICLMVVGIIAFGVVNLIIIPNNNKAQAEAQQQYVINQQDPNTHKLSSIIKCKNKYMGNASNLINLFYSLPMSNEGILFRLFPEKLTVEVNYKDAVWNIQE